MIIDNIFIGCVNILAEFLDDIFVDWIIEWFESFLKNISTDIFFIS